MDFVRLLLLASLLAPPAAGADLDALAAAIGPPEARARIEGVLATAEVDGPRGRFTSEMLALADGTARFRLVRAEGATELLLTGGRVYARSEDGSSLVEASTARVGFVRGHEVHRMLLDLGTGLLPSAPDATADAEGCLDLVFADATRPRICAGAREEEAPPLPDRIVLDASEASGGEPVTLALSDWRELLGVRLPFAVDFLHAGERHAYRYTEVLPFRLTPGGTLPENPTARFERLGDLAALLRAHERTLAAHRASDVSLFLDDEAPRSLEAARGRLSESGREALRQRLGPYLASIRFDRYVDVAVPEVAVAGDGSLGWLACEIDAAGERPLDGGGSEPVAYGFTWVELYARTPDGWRRVGNASSPRP
ncbi:MAG: hypothetical protein H6511_06050 [Holophagales bacterium]|nr:hypothetical protein [Holophagales bacterium]